MIFSMRRFSISVFIYFSWISHVFGAADPLFRLIAVDETAGLEVGRGYDILTGNPRADCVDRSIIEKHTDFGPESVHFKSIKIDDSTQLDRALGISAAASVNAGYGGGSASASFSNALSVSGYTLNYVVDAVVNSKGDSIRDVKLKPQYSKLLSDRSKTSLQRFRTICGDGYIGEFTVGSQFQAVIQIETRSKSESETVAASVSASFSMASGAATFASALKQIAQTNQVRIWSYTRGGNGPIPITADEIGAKASNLPAEAKLAPTPLQATIFSYITLLDDPKIPMTDLTSREVALSYLGDVSRRVRDQRADAQFILDHPSQFYSRPEDLPALASEIKALDDFSKVIEARASICAEAAGNCTTISTPIPSPSARPARR